MSSPRLKKKKKLVLTTQRIKHAFLSLTPNLGSLTPAFYSKLNLNTSI